MNLEKSSRSRVVVIEIEHSYMPYSSADGLYQHMIAISRGIRIHTKPKLISLIKHEQEARAKYPPVPLQFGSTANGIECPECKSELYDAGQRQEPITYPPQRSVMCRECGWKGYRIA